MDESAFITFLFVFSLKKSINIFCFIFLLDDLGDESIGDDLSVRKSKQTTVMSFTLSDQVVKVVYA